MAITRKIELYLTHTGLSDEEYDQQWKFIHNINNNLYRAANRLVNHLYLNDEIDTLLRLNNQKYVDLRKQLAKKDIDEQMKKTLDEQMQKVLNEITNHRSGIISRPQQSFAYSIITEDNDAKIMTKILDVLKQDILSHYKSNAKDVARGERSVSCYRHGMPIPFAFDKSIKLYEEDGQIFLKWYNNLKFNLAFGRDRSNNELIVRRCLGISEGGEGYKACSSSVQIQKRNGRTRIFLLLCVDIPNEKNKHINGKVVGIDLGLNVPIYAATNVGPERKSIGSREAFLNQRATFQRRFRALQRLQMTNGGHGRSHKLEPLERLRDAERNWVKNQNHLFSKEVVEFAKSVEAESIQMERLKDFGRDGCNNVEDDKKYVIRNWSYFELQSMIEYKAKKVGIKVRYVNPAYTSQTCSECGERGERDSTHFKCLNPACKCYGQDIHADYNGARNIAKSKEIIKEKD